MIDYRYNAVVSRWVDGDTVDLQVDLGFTVWVKQRFRLAGINTPERGQPGWAEATAFAAERAPVGSIVQVVSTKTDKYGRYLGDIYVLQPNGLFDKESINEQLVNAGHAVIYS